MSPPAELAERFDRKALFEADFHTLHPAEPRSVARGLRILAVVDGAHHDPNMALRLG
jgi:hypothetical protein